MGRGKHECRKMKGELQVNFWTADADGSERKLIRWPGCSPTDLHVIEAEIRLDMRREYFNIVIDDEVQLVD